MELECEADEGPIFFSFDSDQSNGFLSPTFLSSFRYYTREYNCNEQFFQFSKATWLSNNNELYRAIMSATDPREQKALGKQIKADDASRSHSWATTSELWKHRIWYRRLINSGSGILRYQGCNASEVYRF
jgi:predicted NAD-dependent protein-ADP-ribosyltransferase YbiA (DUF1768 family)